MVIVEYGLTRSKKRIEREFIMTQSVRGNDDQGQSAASAFLIMKVGEGRIRPLHPHTVFS